MKGDLLRKWLGTGRAFRYAFNVTHPIGYVGHWWKNDRPRLMCRIFGHLPDEIIRYHIDPGFEGEEHWLPEYGCPRCSWRPSLHK